MLFYCMFGSCTVADWWLCFVVLIVCVSLFVCCLCWLNDLVGATWREVFVGFIIGVFCV